MNRSSRRRGLPVIATLLSHATRSEDCFQLSNAPLERLDILVLAERHGLLRDNVLAVQAIGSTLITGSAAITLLLARLASLTRKSDSGSFPAGGWAIIPIVDEALQLGLPQGREVRLRWGPGLGLFAVAHCAFLEWLASV